MASASDYAGSSAPDAAEPIHTYVSFAATGSVEYSKNISSVTKDATGKYTINFTNSYSTTDYVPLVSVFPATGTGTVQIASKLTGSVELWVFDGSGSFDNSACELSIIGGVLA